jgi:arylsulfatase A-like enzyme
MSTHALGKRDAATSRFLPAANYVQAEGRRGGLGINFYDNGVAQADAIVSELLETLAAKGYMRNTIVAITADHGECLGEHGLYLHANSVHEPALRIPFLLVSYGHPPGRTIGGHAIASQIDIAPTILAELGFPQPATWSGTPLQSPASRAFTHFQERSSIGVLDHREPENVWKYWFNSRTRREYAFNLSTDPDEKVNAVDRVPPERLREWRRRALIGAKVEEGPGA